MDPIKITLSVCVIVTRTYKVSHSFEDSASDINVNLWPKDVLQQYLSTWSSRWSMDCELAYSVG